MYVVYYVYAYDVIALMVHNMLQYKIVIISHHISIVELPNKDILGTEWNLQLWMLQNI